MISKRIIQYVGGWLCLLSPLPPPPPSLCLTGETDPNGNEKHPSHPRTNQRRRCACPPNIVDQRWYCFRRQEALFAGNCVRRFLYTSFVRLLLLFPPSPSFLRGTHPFPHIHTCMPFVFAAGVPYRAGRNREGGLAEGFRNHRRQESSPRQGSRCVLFCCFFLSFCSVILFF